MAIIDVVSCTMGNHELVAKFPNDDLRLGTQLLVYPGQTAFFVKGGKIFDEFEAGTYTLKTSNIPLLNKIVNLPFGGESPFKAEVYFVNQTAKLDSKWGTATPLQIEDPKYGVIVPVRAYGQYGFRIDKPRLFLETLIGNMSTFSQLQLNKYFKGNILARLTNIISDKLTRDNISVLNINSHLLDISDFCKEKIGQTLERYGIIAQEFDVMSISVKEDDTSFQKLKEAKDLAAKVRIAGRDIYQMDRSFNVLDSAASNEGAAGGLMNAGVGLGVGMNMGNQMGAAFNSTMNLNPPPIPQEQMYFLVINGSRVGPIDRNSVLSYINAGNVTSETFIWKQGMPDWDKIKNLPEFSSNIASIPPPIPNM